MKLGRLFRYHGSGDDHQTDDDRRRRLSAAISGIAEEVRLELDTIHYRYEIASSDAAFLCQAIENEEARDAPRPSQLSVSLLGYEQRITELSRQLGFLGDLRKAAARLSQGEAGDAKS